MVKSYQNRVTGGFRNRVETESGHDPVMQPLRHVRVGCEFVYEAAVETPAVFQVQPFEAGPATVMRHAWETTPELTRHGYTDLYGNGCQRLDLPAGTSTVRYDAVVSVPDATEEVDLDAPEVPVTDLPDEALHYTLPSRYFLPDVLGDAAWERFGATPPGYRRVQEIGDQTTPTSSSATAQHAPHDRSRRARVGPGRVPRLRAPGAHVLPGPEHPGPLRLRLPARHGRRADPSAMDFAAWMEVYLGDRWWTFDPRNNRPRKGRVRHRPRARRRSTSRW